MRHRTIVSYGICIDTSSSSSYHSDKHFAIERKSRLCFIFHSFFCLFLLSSCSSLTFAMSDELSSSEEDGFDTTHQADFTLIFSHLMIVRENDYSCRRWVEISLKLEDIVKFVCAGGEFSHFVLISTHFYFSYVSLESQIVLGNYHSIAGKNSNIFEKKNCVTLTINLFHSEKCFFWSRIILFFSQLLFSLHKLMIFINSNWFLLFSFFTQFFLVSCANNPHIFTKKLSFNPQNSLL